MVELHVAGGTVRDVDGLEWIDDDHGPEPLGEVWQIFAAVAARAKNLKAVVYECERNPAEEVLGNFARIRRVLEP